MEFGLRSLEDCISWDPCLFVPEDLARIGVAAKPLGEVVARVCSHQMQVAGIWKQSPNSTSSFTQAVRALNRVQRQLACAHPTWVAAESFSTGIDSHGCLWIWGLPGWMAPRTVAQDNEHAFSQLPVLAPMAAQVRGAAASRALPKITSVAASRHAVFALTEDYELMFAEVKRRKDDSIRAVHLRPLQEMRGIKVGAISTRFGQAFAVTTDGAVYAWGMRTGDPSKPQHSCSMGFGAVQTLLQPTPLPGFGQGAVTIRTVATGVSHTVFVSTSGQVFTVGRVEAGKLGLGPARECEGNTKHVLRPTKVEFDPEDAPCIVAAAAGARHTLFLASTGDVWGCGMSTTGALATSSPCESAGAYWSPVKMDRLRCRCVSVATGISSSFFLADGGEVYFSGMARQTKCPFGRSDKVDPRDPHQIPGLSRIREVTVSMELSAFQWEHAMFVAADGCIFAWGHHGHGEFRPDELEEPGHRGAAGYCVEEERATQAPELRGEAAAVRERRRRGEPPSALGVYDHVVRLAQLPSPAVDS